ncbi:MAG: response regulator receiver protein, partial [uncultured bacterium]
MCDCCHTCETEENENENIFLPKEATILRVEQTTPQEKHFTLRMKDESQLMFDPGQILEVSLFGYGEIPIGLASSPTRTNTFDIVVRSVGRVSKAINKLEKGDSLFVRGPFGNGFDLKKFKNQKVLVVAGGIGLCPTRSMVQYILDKRSDFADFTLFYGTKNPSQQLFIDDLKIYRSSPSVKYFETVDQG